MQITLTSIPVEDPIKAHKFYTEILGFDSKEFQSEAQLAIVVSPEDPNGTALLLEPRGDSFAKEFQAKVSAAGLPIIVFGVKDLPSEIQKLKARGVQFRDDLAKPEWGMENIFEDTCGNFVMLEGIAAG